MTTATRNRLSNIVPAQFSREMGELFDSIFDGGSPRTRPAWQTPASVWEENDKFHVEIDLPGVTQENLELTFEKGSLSITAERPAPEGERTKWLDERAYGKVTRVVSLPDSANAEQIDAELVNGVLHVSVSKKPEAQAKRIEVKTV